MNFYKIIVLSFVLIGQNLDCSSIEQIEKLKKMTQEWKEENQKYETERKQMDQKWKEKDYQRAVGYIKDILEVEKIGIVETFNEGQAEEVGLKVGIHLSKNVILTRNVRFLQEDEVAEFLDQNRTFEEYQKVWIQSLLTGQATGTLSNKIKDFHSHVEYTDVKLNSSFSQVVRTFNCSLQDMSEDSRQAESKNKYTSKMIFGDCVESGDDL